MTFVEGDDSLLKLDLNPTKKIFLGSCSNEILVPDFVDFWNEVTVDMAPNEQREASKDNEQKKQTKSQIKCFALSIAKIRNENVEKKIARQKGKGQPLPGNETLEPAGTRVTYVLGRQVSLRHFATWYEKWENESGNWKRAFMG